MLRVAGKDTGLLGIDRTVELAATEAAAALGIGPEVVAFVEPEGWLVTRFVDGAIPPLERMREPVMLARVAARAACVPRRPGDPGHVRLVPRRRDVSGDRARSRRPRPGGLRLGARARDEDRGEALGGQRRFRATTTS